MKLAVKLLLALLAFGIIIVVAAILVGRSTFTESIQKMYNDTAYQIAEVAEHYFTEEEIANYAETALQYARGEISKEDFSDIEKTERYQMIHDQINQLRKSMGANDIYVCALDEDAILNADPNAERVQAIIYLVDSYVKEDESYPFGYLGDFNAAFAQAVLQIYESGQRMNDYFISNGAYGYNTTALYPVVQDGQTVAMIAVEIPMSSLQSTINAFMVRVIVSTLIVFVIVLALIFFLVNRMVTKPVLDMANAAESYVSSKEKKDEDTEEASPISQLSVQTGDELEVLCRSLKEMEGDLNQHIENLKRVTAEKERIGAELNVATQIQADMLPSIFPAFPQWKTFDLYASMTPAKEVGGDFYDFFLIDKDHLGLVIADVSGKGVPAALFMVIAKTLIKNRAMMGGDPSEILNYVNNQLCEGNEAELFVTVWMGILDLNTGKGLAANAGHEHPAIRRANGEFELSIYKHSMAVAAMEGVPFKQHEFELHPGDSLFVYTDGVPEATNANGELYGTDRMIEALNKNPDASIREILENVKKDVDAFVGDAPQFDDLTMLGFRFYD